MAAGDAIQSGFSLTLNTIHNWVLEFYTLLPNIIVGIIILAIFGIGSWSISHFVSRYFDRKDRKDLGRLLADFIFWLIFSLGVLVFLTIIIPSLKPVDLLSSLGIGSLAFGFAFKDILQNWLSGLLILLRLPFRRGDQIRVGEAEGTVQRIEPRATIIRTYDGRDIVVPNTTIYTSVVVIHTSQETRRVEIDFTVGYAYDIRHITKIIKDALTQISEIIKNPEPQILCWELGATSLGVKVRWWINSERSQEVISRARVIQAIKEAFDANDIDPTDPQLIYYRQSENLPTDDPSNAPQHANNRNKYDAPPKIKISKDDPEADKPKIDSKDETMLPNN